MLGVFIICLCKNVLKTLSYAWILILVWHQNKLLFSFHLHVLFKGSLPFLCQLLSLGILL